MKDCRSKHGYRGNTLRKDRYGKALKDPVDTKWKSEVPEWQQSSDKIMEMIDKLVFDNKYDGHIDSYFKSRKTPKDAVSVEPLAGALWQIEDLLEDESKQECLQKQGDEGKGGDEQQGDKGKE